MQWIASALFSLAAYALPAAAQNDDYRRCEQYRESDPDLALQNCSSAIQSGHLSAEQLVHALNSRGRAFSMKGDSERAIQDFDQAIRIAPNDAEAHRNLGTALGERGDLESAIKELREALRIKPDYTKAHNSLGTAFAKKGDLDAAIQQHPGDLLPILLPQLDMHPMVTLHVHTVRPILSLQKCLNRYIVIRS